MVPLPSTVVIPTVQNSTIDADGVIGDNERVNANTDKLCKYDIYTLLNNIQNFQIDYFITENYCGMLKQ